MPFGATCYFTILLLFLLVKGDPGDLDTRRERANGYDDLVGVRIDTASAVKDYNSGLIVIKGNTNVTVRLYGTRLHDLKNVRITKNTESCSASDAVTTIKGESLSEISPPTAAFNFIFPQYSTTYYFCFEWLRPAYIQRMAPMRNNGKTKLRDNENGTVGNMTGGPKRDTSAETYVHQGSARFLSVATGQRSWWGII